jgi:hypothetical protein
VLPLSPLMDSFPCHRPTKSTVEAASTWGSDWIPAGVIEAEQESASAVYQHQCLSYQNQEIFQHQLSLKLNPELRLDYSQGVLQFDYCFRAFLPLKGAAYMPRRPRGATDDQSVNPGNKPRVRFIFEPDRTSPYGITYTWLIHDTYNSKEKAATATRASWLPFACRHSAITLKRSCATWSSSPSGRLKPRCNTCRKNLIWS